MKKKGLLLVVGLFVLVAAACATPSSTPSLTASDSSKDDKSASVAATGTPDDRYQALIGEWRGSTISMRTWYPVILIIHEIDIANSKARCTFSIYTEGTGTFGYFGLSRSMDNPVEADFIPRPNPKIQWGIRRGEVGEGQFEFVLKGNVLEGTMIGSGYGYLWTESMQDFIKPTGNKKPPSLKIIMEKQLKK